MRRDIEKAISLVRQGQNKRALKVLCRIRQQLPPDDEDEDTGEITLELAIPMEFPSVDIQMSEDGEHYLVVDQEDEWVIGHQEAMELQELCTPLQHLRFLNTSDVNVYKMSVTAKLKEMVLVERVVKR